MSLQKIDLVTKAIGAYTEKIHLSSGSPEQEKNTQARGELVRELRRFTGLGASYFRAAATRLGMNVTDLEVMDILDSAGPTTAGQLADLTGLTTGAITQMLDRLEEAGRVRRERDPNDGRRVIIRLAPGKDDKREMSSVFAPLGKAWDDIASHYDDERVAFLLEFLKRANAVSSEEIALLRETPAGGGVFSAPLGDLKSAQLVVPTGIFQLTVRADEGMTDLYQARFKGPTPDVKANDGVVTIRNPRRKLILGGKQGAADVALNATIPWRIMIQGGAAEITAELGGLNLAGLEVKGGMSTSRLELPTPTTVVPIRISGGTSVITILRPVGVAARAHLKGWVTQFNFDDQVFNNMGNDVRLQSANFVDTAPYYDIEVASSASMVTITTG